MNAVAFKTKDGLICIDSAPDDIMRYGVIRRATYQAPKLHKWPVFTEPDPAELIDILTRTYEYRGERHRGFPVFEEI